MDFSKLLKFKDVIATVAPTIATVLGGPLIGTAVTALSKAVLGHENGTEDEIAKVLATASPDILLKIKDAEFGFKVEMKKLEVDLDKLEVSDRASARKMKEVVGGYIQEILATIFVGGYFIILYNLITGKVVITQENQALILILVGIMSASVTQIMNFYFGSSKGSKEKTAAMSNMIVAK